MLIEKLKLKKQDLFFAACVLVSFVLLCAGLFLCFSDSIWVDEVFSADIIKGSYLDIVINTAVDVHPPLYYFILKFFAAPLEVLLPFLSNTVILKLISYSSVVIMFFFLVKKMPNVLNKTLVGLILVTVFALGAFETFAITIRMYGFASLFLLICLYFTLKVIRRGSKSDFRFFILFFELASLTHYFALIGAAGLLLFILIYYLIKKRSEFLFAYKYAFFAVLFYVPWLVVMCCQFAYIIGVGYWISSITKSGFLEFFNFILFPDLLGNLISNKTIITFILLAVYLAIFALLILSKKISKKEKWSALAGAFMAAFVLGVGFFVSVAITPIFVTKYTVPIILPFYISVLYSLYLLAKNHICVEKLKLSLAAIGLVFISIYSCFAMSNLYKLEDKFAASYVHIVEFIENNKSKNIVFDNGNPQATIEHIGNNMSTYALSGYDAPWWENVTKIEHERVDIAKIYSWLEGETEVLLVRYDMDMSKFTNEGIKFEVVDKLEFDAGYSCNVYRLYI